MLFGISGPSTFLHNTVVNASNSILRFGVRVEYLYEILDVLSSRQAYLPKDESVDDSLLRWCSQTSAGREHSPEASTNTTSPWGEGVVS